MKIQQINVAISNLPDDFLPGWVKYLEFAVNNVYQFETPTAAELTKAKADLEKLYFEMWKRAFKPVVAELKIRLIQLKNVLQY